MKEQIFRISGMHCAACSASVEKVTRKLEGVESADVNLITEKLVVRFDPKLCDSSKIIEKVNKAGFEASIYKEEKKSDGSDWKSLVLLIISVVLSVFLTYVSMGHMAEIVPVFWQPGLHPYIYALTQLCLALPVVLIGYRFYVGGFGSLFRGHPDMNTLVALSSTASMIFSIVSLLRINSDPTAVKTLYFESAAGVIAFVSVGKYLEARCKKKTAEAINALAGLVPDTAFRVEKIGASPKKVPIASLYLGDIILIRAGERIPCDALVCEGSGSSDESMLTGESLPVDKKPGDTVFAGSILTDGAVYANVSAIAHDTVLAGIVRLVEDAQNKKAPVSKFADKVAGFFVPVVCLAAFIAAFIWFIIGRDFAFSVKIFTSVLVVACPCAMGLATPTAIMAGTGLGARNGILVRSGAALEMLCHVDTLVFDKTGTLTEGKPAVSYISSFGSLSEDELLAACASLEKLSTHPLALAICRESEKRALATSEVENFENVAGLGLRGTIDCRKILVGKKEFCKAISETQDSILTKFPLNSGYEGGTEIYINIDGRTEGCIILSDSIRPGTAELIARLHNKGCTTVLLTGDGEGAALDTARKLGIKDVRYGILPGGKAAAVEQLRKNGAKVAMIGDGINDAPALSAADVGIAIGSGTDVARASADVVLTRSDLSDVEKAIRLGHMTLANIKQNLYWAFFYNFFAIPIACGLLYNKFHFLITPTIGALAMCISSLLVVTNALRLGRGKI